MIDLHTHTNYSDATTTLKASLEKAEKLGLSLFSVSDHNTVAAYSELIERRSEFSGKVIPAIELSCLYKGNPIEVLGYGIDLGAMNEAVKAFGFSNADYNTLVLRNDIAKLIEKGVLLDKELVTAVEKTPELVFAEAKKNPGGSRSLILKSMRNFGENARFFENADEFQSCSRHTFFRKYLNNIDSVLYIDRSEYLPTVEKAADVIHKTGGLAFLAHLYNYSENVIDDLDGIVSKNVLDGLECYYGTFTKAQQKTLSDYCKAHDLFMSGGSDYHGLDMRPDNIMGLSAGEPIPFEVIAPWFDKVKDSVI